MILGARNRPREAAARAIAEIREKYDREAARRAKVREAAEQRRRAALQELDAANAALLAVKREDMNAAHAFTVAIGPHEALMRETADGVLAPFLTRIHEEWRRLQDSPPEDIIETRREFLGYRDERPVYEHTTNSELLKARVSRLGAIKSEALRLAESQADLGEADLERLWESLPSEHLADC